MTERRKPKYIPRAPIKKLIHDAGAEKVSETLVDEIIWRLEDYALFLAQKALVVCRFRGEIVARAKHLKLALEIDNRQK